MTLRFGFAALRLALIVSLIGIALVVHPDRSHANLCLPPESPSQALEEADAVFAGRVASLRYHQKEEGILSTADPVTVEFDVSTVWKGPNSKTRHLTTSRGGYTLYLGFEYLVYSHDGDVGCGTRPLSEAAYELAELGPGQAAGQAALTPTPTVSEPEVTGRGQDVPTPTPPAAEAQAPGAPESQTPAASEPQTNSSGCGSSPHTIDLAVVGLMVGAVWFGVGRRRADAIDRHPR